MRPTENEKDCLVKRKPLCARTRDGQCSSMYLLSTFPPNYLRQLRSRRTERDARLLLFRSLSLTTRLCFGNDIKAGCECGARIYQSAAADLGASRFGSVVDEHTRFFQCVKDNLLLRTFY